MSTKSTIAKHFASFMLAATVGLFGGSTGAQELPAEADAVMQLSMLTYDNRNPSAAYSPDGSQLFIAWDGVVDGRRRIMLRERIAGEWLPAVIVDTNPAGNNSHPSVAVDESGTPHITWISTLESRRYPVYARRLNRVPNSWFVQPLPFPLESTVRGGSDYANLQLDDNGSPWIVWQYGFGNVYSIACTRYTENGELETTELTPGAMSHNLYPELFFMPDPTVYWYLAQTDQFFLIGSSFDPDTDQWIVSLPENLDNLPADNLPDLFQTSTGILGALWYDKVLPYGTDRIFLGIQDEESKGRGEVIDEQPASGNHSVAGNAQDGQFVTVWVSETYEGGANVHLGTGASPDSIVTYRVSDHTQALSSNPKVTSGAGSAAVVWEEAGSPDHQSSHIYVRTIELNSL